MWWSQLAVDGLVFVVILFLETIKVSLLVLLFELIICLFFAFDQICRGKAHVVQMRL